MRTAAEYMSQHQTEGDVTLFFIKYIIAAIIKKATYINTNSKNNDDIKKNA